MKLLRYSCVGLAIVLGFITIVASIPCPCPTEILYVDNDEDTYGSQVVCTDELVCVADDADCDDRVDGEDGIPGNADDGANIYPDAFEIGGNDVDENCDGIIAGTRFSDMGDGTVRDEDSGLIWLKDANCSELAGTDSSGRADWTTANDVAAAGLTNGTCGLTDGSIAGDWRLPTKEEWEAFVDQSYYHPALCNAAGTGQWAQGDAFTGVQSHDYWSSTEANDTVGAWGVYMPGGNEYCGYKDENTYVWPVRSDN